MRKDIALYKQVGFFLKRLYERYMDDDVGSLAAETTYYLILSVVPFLIFIINMILFFAASQIELVARLISYLPIEIRNIIEPVVINIINARSVMVLSIGLLAAVWSASKGIDTLIRATDKAFRTDKNIQTYFWIKCKSILFTLLIAGMMLLSLTLLVFGNAFAYAWYRYMDLNKIISEIWNIAKFLIPFIGAVSVFSIFYRYAPKFIEHEGRTPWRYTFVSAVSVTLLWLLFTGGYGYYITNIANLGTTYGSLLGVMVLFIWLNLTAFVIIMGAEFIVAFDETKLYFAIPDEEDYQKHKNKIV